MIHITFLLARRFRIFPVTGRADIVIENDSPVTSEENISLMHVPELKNLVGAGNSRPLVAMSSFDSTGSLNDIRNRLKKMNRSDVRIIAVSKTHGPEKIRELLKAGHRDFGENRANEGRDKFRLVKTQDLAYEHLPVYHHIGPLQSGGARQLPFHFHWVHGASSLKAIRILAESALRFAEKYPPASDAFKMNYLIQIALTDEAGKAGGMTPAVFRGLDEIPENEALRFKGFMTMGPEDMDPIRIREVFHRLRELRDEILPGGELSMGMSGDWEIAVEEGATMIRLGSTIFGPRGPGPWKPEPSHA